MEKYNLKRLYIVCMLFVGIFIGLVAGYLLGYNFVIKTAIPEKVENGYTITVGNNVHEYR